MRFRIFTEPQQGANYDDILAVAQPRRFSRIVEKTAWRDGVS